MKNILMMFFSWSLLLGTPALHPQLAYSAPDSTHTRLSKALYSIQDSTIDFLTGKTGDRNLVKSMKLLSSKNPRGAFKGMDKTVSKSLYTAWHNWHVTHNPDYLDKFLVTLDKAKQRYKPYEIPPNIRYISKYLRRNLKGSTPEEEARIKSAAEDAWWMWSRLHGVQITPECKESMASLDRAITDFKATGNPKILQALALDLRTKVKHCDATGERPDQPTKFTFDTENSNQTKLKGWVVYARPQTNPIGNMHTLGPSTPVKDAKLMPGRWLFYAVKDHKESVWREVTVFKGSIDPVIFLIDLP